MLKRNIKNKSRDKIVGGKTFVNFLFMLQNLKMKLQSHVN